MRALAIVGAILLVAGVLSLIIPIPHREHHGIEAGPVSFGIDTTERQRVHPAISGVLIAGGVAMIIAGTRKRAA
jgi:hypothetical protein